MTEPRAQAGFTLIEVVISTALLATVIAAAVGTFAALTRGAEPDRVRDLATQVARNQLTYARAATIYAPASENGIDTATLATFENSRTWAIATGKRTFTTSVTMVETAGACGGTSTTMSVPLTVTSDYEESAVAHAFTVSVTYPPNPCVPATTSSVTLSEELGPVAVVPGTVVTNNIANPPWGQ